MRSWSFREWLIVAGFLVVALFLLFVVIKSASAEQPQPCAAGTSPCIEVTTAAGQKYTFNDFRFAPGHCLQFLSLPDNISRKTCGNYHMDWIGPTS